MNRAEALKELSEMQTESWTDTRQREAVNIAIKAMKVQNTIDELNAIKSVYSAKDLGDHRLMHSEIKALDDAIKAVSAIDNIKADIEKAKEDFNEYNDYQIGVRQGFRFALEIIGNHTRGAD